MSDILYAELSFADETVRLWGTPHGTGLYISDEGIEGWYGTPDAKWELTERSGGDGAYDLADADILYAARTVTLHAVAVEDNRAEVLAAVDSVKRCAHRKVRLRVVDETSDTYVEGYATVEADATWARRHHYLTVTVQCPRPERLGTSSHVCYLNPLSSNTDGGLYYGADALGLSYPLSYQIEAETQQNTNTIVNDGTSRAYPVLTVYAGFSGGFRITLTDDEGSSAIQYDATVVGSPVVVDFRSRTASVAGLDRSRYLSERGFRSVKPGSSLTASLNSSGTGWVMCRCWDTYI